MEKEFYSYAIAFTSRRDDGTPFKVTTTLKELGLSAPGGYHVKVMIIYLQLLKSKL